MAGATLETAKVLRNLRRVSFIWDEPLYAGAVLRASAAMLLGFCHRGLKLTVRWAAQ